jgi:quercetin dioxygenase-like cupin family protein
MRGESSVEITRNSKDTSTGPPDWFTGDVYIDPIAVPAQGSRINASSVHFTPGARTAWHAHPNGQTIYVTEGVGRVARRGGDVHVIRPGDRVFFQPGEDHWHGASPTRFMTHLSLVEVDDAGNSATWAHHVTDDEYRAPASLEDGVS